MGTIKKLQDNIDLLENKNKTLEARIKSLETRLSSIISKLTDTKVSISSPEIFKTLKLITKGTKYFPQGSGNILYLYIPTENKKKVFIVWNYLTGNLPNLPRYYTSLPSPIKEGSNYKINVGESNSRGSYTLEYKLYEMNFDFGLLT